MEHPCHRCGAAVEEGVPFCPQCNAPLIRVAGVPSAARPAPESEDILPAQQAAPRNATPATGLQWSQALPAAALAGLVAAAVMVIPLGAFGLGMLMAGALSVVLYRRRNPAANLTPGMGARLGAASGALGFGIFAIITSIEMVLLRNGGQIRAALLEAIRQSAARTSDPQARELLESFKTPGGLALLMVLGLMLMFVVFLILSSLGGAIGASLLRRKDRL